MINSRTDVYVNNVILSMLNKRYINNVNAVPENLDKMNFK
jgi:hypothetical protein